MTNDSVLAEAERQPSLHSPQQRSQEEQYGFPYHHVPQWGGDNFRPFRVLPAAHEYAACFRFFMDRLSRLEFTSILDLGCGDGRLTAELCARFPQAEVTGIDISDRAIAFARAFAPRAQFVCGDIRDARGIPAKVDLVVMMEVLEHIDPDEAPRLLEAARKLLPPDGRLLLTVPSANVAVPQKHYRHFDGPLLRLVLDPFFLVEEIAFLHRISRWQWFLDRLICNPVFILSHRRSLERVFRFYVKHFWPATADTCKTLFAMCRRRP